MRGKNNLQKYDGLKPQCTSRAFLESQYSKYSGKLTFFLYSSARFDEFFKNKARILKLMLGRKSVRQRTREKL